MKSSFLSLARLVRKNQGRLLIAMLVLTIMLGMGAPLSAAYSASPTSYRLTPSPTDTSTPTHTPSATPMVNVVAGMCPSRQLTRLEANYILACQDNRPKDPAYGAINDVYGAPTWIVPGEGGTAAWGLDLASDILNDPSYRNRARLALKYLIKVQRPDGSWANQYSYMVPHDDVAESPHSTAEVMMALYKLDYYPQGYNAMTRGAQYLLDCQNVANKHGNDDGLLGAGKNRQGQFESWRWVHDNAYSYWALKAAQSWAIRAGKTYLASTYAASARRILQGINTYLYDPKTGVWHIAIDANGKAQWISNLPNRASWLQFAPQLLDLPATGVNSPRVGKWIHDTFQQSDGSVIGYSWEGGLVVRKYPGLAFQAALAWFDTGNTAYAKAAIQWALGSGLWQTTPDQNGIKGGWIDWAEVSPKLGTEAPEWQRFIDTSFYAIAACNGGYDFRIP